MRIAALRMARLFFLLSLAAALLFACSCCDDDCRHGDDCHDFGDDDGDDDDTDANPDDCTTCHEKQGEAWENFSSHRALYSCESCHEEAVEVPGPGHRARPWCDSCHSEATHAPTYFPEPDSFRLISCATCHEPHGSTNIFLIQETILVGPNDLASVVFENTDGLASGSYAEPGAGAGRGLCEICHTGTAFYRRDGSGDAHNTTRCSTCHDHAGGFITPN